MTSHISSLGGYIPRKYWQQEEFYCFAPWRGGIWFVTAIIPLVQNLNRFLVSHLGQGLDLAHPHILICSVAAWGPGQPLGSFVCVTNWSLHSISLTPCPLLRIIISVRDNLRIICNFNWLEKGAQFSSGQLVRLINYIETAYKLLIAFDTRWTFAYDGICCCVIIFHSGFLNINFLSPQLLNALLCCIILKITLLKMANFQRQRKRKRCNKTIYFQHFFLIYVWDQSLWWTTCFVCHKRMKNNEILKNNYTASE